MKKKNRVDKILVIILLSYFIILLDNSIVFTGTVRIAEELHLNQLELSWVTTAYSLTFGGFLLFGGRAGDLFGRKKVLMIGLILFGIGSLLVGLSGNAFSIILFRAFQGIGSAILAPTTLALLMDNYQGESRTKAVAYYGATAGIGASLGLVLGGVFASLVSWRVGFIINVPISLFLFVLAKKYLVDKERRSGAIDYIGTLISIFGMTALVYSIVGEKYQFVSFIAALVLLSFFIYQEATTNQPIMPLRLFKNAERLGGYLARFLYIGAMISFWFLTPQIMQYTLGFSPLLTGFGFFPLTILNFIVALQVAPLTKRFGNGCLVVVGISMTLIGMMWMSRFNLENGYWFGIALPMVFLGIGQGISLSPLTVAGIANTLEEDAGAAAGVVNMVHQVGGSIGLAVVVALTSGIQDRVASFHVAMLLTSSFLIASLVLVLILIFPNETKKI